DESRPRKTRDNNARMSRPQVRASLQWRAGRTVRERSVARNRPDRPGARWCREKRLGPSITFFLDEGGDIDDRAGLSGGRRPRHQASSHFDQPRRRRHARKADTKVVHADLELRPRIQYGAIENRGWNYHTTSPFNGNDSGLIL